MKKFLLICTLLSAGVLLNSCSKQLDVDIVSDITGEGYWKSEGDMEAYLNGIYNRFRNTFNTTYYFEDRSDAFVPGLESGLSSAWQHNLSPQNAPNWLNFYTVIHHANLLLKNGPAITQGSSENKNRMMAEAYFLRAYTYFSLLRSWGDVPLELEPTEGDDKPQLPRAPATEVMAQVLRDIDQAIALFPESGFVNKSRASAPAAYALKADALLWKAKVLGGGNDDLQGAIEAADQAIASGGLGLEATFWHIYATDRKNGKEVLFSIHFKSDEKSDHYASQLKPRDIFVQDAVNKSKIAYAKSGARSAYAPSPKIEAAFKYSGDIRKAETFIKAMAPDGSVIGVFDNKMRGSVVSGNRVYDSDIIVYRLAELFLFKAEALAALGRIDEAIVELNKVRSRAKIAAYSGPQDKLTIEKEILEERFRELFLEGKRWPDLLRFHFGGTIDVYDEVPNLSGSSIPLFFPIPQVQIDRNPALTQTKGY